MRALEESYDVVVVGAGPAGSMSSYNASKNGAKTLLIEKAQEIGTPVRCAEAIPRIESFGINPSSEFIRSYIKGAYLVAPNGKKITVKGGKTDGYVVERKIFDKFLAIRSAKEGTKIAVKSRVTGLEKTEEGYNVFVNHLGKEYTVKTKLVIAADGVESTISEYAGLKSKKNHNEVCSCAEYEMTNVKLLDNNMMEFYFGEICPKGYIWLFPKGDTVNVGIGIIEGSKKAIEYLDDFLSNPLLEGRLKNAVPVEFKVGGDPVGGPIKKTFKDNLIVVGDAAGHVSPLTGGGISLAMDCGLIAGEVCAKSISSKNYSEEFLSQYETRWKEKHYKFLMNDLKYKTILQKLNDNELNAIADSIPENLEEVDVGKLAIKIVKKAPSLLKYFKELI
ncbi:geranylgeranyl reductase [Methanococcus vannielii SB]|jgi:digeranylgeranylglycerophospholipid reductase|uniref:Digeranylgeranylglycerophospholipid reductase n=1 Tax=Methanococcus vannielii (strain ATCC 35089 / DSM 1224 / JCM 13029 / OCM 148 / SB) TaxID=406327 RepID=GGR_METVS|nr:NAD(P)/FAD-dependent oxidoreductase [Methanococcus vannielii]A6US00.1 RecName: Full=Digeranylgeranylglycerophospholipid reductase; Short=DGGGPL reductase; AltName: Full=2,3-bis-O-geranylgeranylglyceryl phosphate reductase; AltName: Full=Geranylgeranyl reductase; Short=GGR [Methanococcus vannielii SB]ABR55272.1 geranylgeranyl reductase [Methanococcus vannielii SB]